MKGFLQNLRRQDVIVNPDGTPTEYFMKMLEGSTDVVGTFADSVIVGGPGLDVVGSGSLADGDVELDPNASEILDLISNVRGTVLYRGAAGWLGRAPGIMGQIFETGGAGADPVWSNLSTIIDFISNVRGTILYRGASGWAALAPGTAGNALLTGGAGADPSWGALSFPNQLANKIFAGPTSGGAAAPTFRSLVAADLLGLATMNYIMPQGWTTTPTASEVLFLHTFAETVTFAANWAGIQKYVGTNPTGTFNIDVSKSTGGGAFSTVGTLSLSTGGALTATTSGGTTVVFNAGDTIKYTAQVGVDATLANFAITQKGTRS